MKELATINHSSSMTTRREFVKKTGKGLLAAGTFSMLSDHDLYGNIPAKALQSDLFRISFAGYTFRDFDLDETLEMMQKMDARYLCTIASHLPLTSTQEEIAAYHAKLAAKNITVCGVNPIYMRTEAEVDRAFDFVRRIGLKVLTGVPNHELLPYVDKKVKEYDILFAIHNHGPDIPLYPDSDDVFRHIKDLDPRIGVCLDMAHTTRNGSDPVHDLKKYHKRVFDIHLCDATEASKAGQFCALGRGIVNIPAFMHLLREVKYSGCCNIELTANKENCFAAAIESMGYIKGVADATR